MTYRDKFIEDHPEIPKKQILHEGIPVCPSDCGYEPEDTPCPYLDGSGTCKSCWEREAPEETE